MTPNEPAQFETAPSVNDKKLTSPKKQVKVDNAPSVTKIDEQPKTPKTPVEAPSVVKRDIAPKNLSSAVTFKVTETKNLPPASPHRPGGLYLSYVLFVSIKCHCHV